MDAARNYHTKLSQKDKDKIPCDITFMCNITYDTNETVCDTEKNQRHKEQTGGCQGGGGWESRSGSLGLADAIYYV